MEPDPRNIVPPLLFRDALMLVIDKPSGLPVHPGRGGGTTLSDHLDALRFGLPRRPEAVHRLDRDTSGCLVLGRHAAALTRLNRLFRDRRVGKTYWTVVEGGPAEPSGEIDLALSPVDPRRTLRMRPDAEGQPSLTRWRVLGRDPDRARTWLELEPVTGRTHQLRVHCAASGWPIVGDVLYGAPATGGLHLHASGISIPLYPRKPPIAVEAPRPARMEPALTACGWPEPRA